MFWANTDLAWPNTIRRPVQSSMRFPLHCGESLMVTLELEDEDDGEDSDEPEDRDGGAASTTTTAINITVERTTARPLPPELMAILPFSSCWLLW